VYSGEGEWSGLASHNTVVTAPPTPIRTSTGRILLLILTLATR